MTVDPSYKPSKLSEVIIGVFYEVYNELGYGFSRVCLSKLAAACTYCQGFAGGN
jgi:hypothetical protein